MTSTFSSRKLFSGWPLALAALGICWLLFFNTVRGEWRINPQYSYGYVVPLMGALLLWRRWADRPVAHTPNLLPAGLIAGVLLFSLLPWLTALEANPEWRLLYWLGGALVIGLSLCTLYLAGGWSWVRYFAPPILFMLIAVPWPMSLEQSIVQNLMRLVAGLTVEVAGALNIPAVQHGNLIEVGVGVVGIDEACSGVRSLQSALMLSLFIGEAQRFSWPRRMTLLIASLLFVLIANLCRTTFLVWTAVHQGLHQMEARHDLAGNLVMLIVLPSLLGLGYVLKPRGRLPVPAPSKIPLPTSLPSIPRWMGAGALAWIGLSCVLNEAWYRAHESTLVSNPRWSVAWPADNLQFRRTSIPERSLTILRCSNSDSAVWRDDEGNDWSGFLLRWEPGKNSAQLAKGHRPDICFPASGARLIHDFGRTIVSVQGLELPFHYQTFDSGGEIANVFYCLWADRRAADEKTLREDGSEASRFEAIVAGKRHLGQQVLEVVIRGPEPGDQAIKEFTRRLPELIRVNPMP